MAFELPKLNYAYDALEPHIDARTMEIHHSKHHQGYTTKLNAAIEGTADASSSIEAILTNLDLSNGAVRNNGGGFYNHCLFWEVMAPNAGGVPSGSLASAIDEAFGSLMLLKMLLLRLRLLNLVLDGHGYVFKKAVKLKCALLQTKTIQSCQELDVEVRLF